MKYIIGLLSCVLLFGCGSSATNRRIDDSRLQANSAVEHIKAIKTSGDNIDTLTDDPAVRDETKQIDQHADAATKEVNALSKNNEKLGRDLLAERESSLKKYKSILTLVSIISGLGIFVAIGLALTGHLRDFKLMTIAACVFAGSIALLFVFQYLLWIAIIAGILALGLVIYTFVNNTAMKQILESVEQAKKDGVISWEEFSGIADNIQKGFTKKIVDSWQKAKGHK